MFGWSVPVGSYRSWSIFNAKISNQLIEATELSQQFSDESTWTTKSISQRVINIYMDRFKDSAKPFTATFHRTVSAVLLRARAQVRGTALNGNP